MDDREKQLIDWFKGLFGSRTPPKSIQDAHPDYRVTWHETAAKMKELGYTDPPPFLRVAWGNLFAQHKLRAWCNKLIKATDGIHLVSRESATSKETREKYES